MITAAQLIAAGVDPAQAALFAEPLSAACAMYAIDSPKRIAAFVSQCSHESAGFSHLVEDLTYTTPARIREMWPTRVRSDADALKLCRNPEGLANVAYANRMGNSDASSGDGWMEAPTWLVYTK